MSDEQNNGQEYVYNEQKDPAAALENPYAASGSASSSGPDGVSKRFSRQQVLGLLGFCLIAFFTYKLFGLLFHGHQHTPAGTKLLAHHQEKTAPAKTTDTKTAAAKPAEAKKKLSLVDVWSQEKAQRKNRAEQVDSNFTHLQAGVGGVEEQITTLNNTLLDIQQELAAQKQMLIVMKKAIAPQQAKKPARKVSHLPIYYIRALLPGRAWLQRDGGGAMTVRSGDLIPGRGWVKKIDVDHGMVVTSTGYMIEFPPSES